MQNKSSFESRLLRLSLLASVTGLIMLTLALVYAKLSIWLTLLIVLLMAVLIAYCNVRIYQKLVYQFRSLNNLIDAMQHGDYSLRVRSNRADSEFSQLITSINGLASRLTQQRNESIESQLLAHTVIEHIDVAIIAMDDHNEISFHNPAAKRLLDIGQQATDETLAEQLSVVKNLKSGHNQIVALSLGRQSGKFNIHIEEFREAGVQKKLLFITDVRTLLRSEERRAWQSLVRVISHEINNSLSPISSISQTLNGLIGRTQILEETKNDLLSGLGIISERAEGLKEFVNSYKKLANLPEPIKEAVSLGLLVDRTLKLFKDQEFTVSSEKDLTIYVDSVQLEQVLINLIKNAVEATALVEAREPIEIKWRDLDGTHRIEILDHGGGVLYPENLFVPFYSTKKQGSGIGLVLCRQIVEAHSGSLIIENRTGAVGCTAVVELPSTT